MFSTFIILVIYHLILSRCSYIPSLSSEEKTLSFKEQVKEELDSMKDSFNKINDSQLDINAKRELIKIQRLMEDLIMREVKLVNEMKSLFKKQGVLEVQIENSATYQLVLAITFRVDTLEKLLAPGEDLKGMQRSKRWIYILAKKTPEVENLRKKVYAAEMNEVCFAGQIERLILERNSIAPPTNIPLPRLIEKKTIHRALQILRIIEYEAIETLKILVAPVEGLNITTT